MYVGADDVGGQARLAAFTQTLKQIALPLISFG
jgi:hypothetical protein